MCGYYFKGSLIRPKLKHLCLWSILNQVIETLFESWSRDQGDLRTAKTNRSRRHRCNLTLNHWKSNNQAHFLTIKNFDPSCKSLKQATSSNFSLPFRHYWTTGNQTIRSYRMGRSNASNTPIQRNISLIRILKLSQLQTGKMWLLLK